jgi:hypothetical protein
MIFIKNQRVFIGDRYAREWEKPPCIQSAGRLKEII